MSCLDDVLHSNRTVTTTPGKTDSTNPEWGLKTNDKLRETIFNSGDSHRDNLPKIKRTNSLIQRYLQDIMKRDVLIDSFVRKRHIWYERNVRLDFSPIRLKESSSSRSQRQWGREDSHAGWGEGNNSKSAYTFWSRNSIAVKFFCMCWHLSKKHVYSFSSQHCIRKIIHQYRVKYMRMQLYSGSLQAPSRLIWTALWDTLLPVWQFVVVSLSTRESEARGLQVLACATRWGPCVSASVVGTRGAGWRCGSVGSAALHTWMKLWVWFPARNEGGKVAQYNPRTWEAKAGGS